MIWCVIIDFYWLVEPINNNRYIIIDYYWLLLIILIAINDWFSLIDIRRLKTIYTRTTFPLTKLYMQEFASRFSKRKFQTVKYFIYPVLWKNFLTW